MVSDLLRAYFAGLRSSVEELDKLLQTSNSTNEETELTKGLKGDDFGSVEGKMNLQWLVDIIFRIAEEARVCADSLTKELAVESFEASVEGVVITPVEVAHKHEVESELLSTYVKDEVSGLDEGGGGGGANVEIEVSLSSKVTNDKRTEIVIEPEKVGHSYGTRRQKGKTKVSPSKAVTSGSGTKKPESKTKDNLRDKDNRAKSNTLDASDAANQHASTLSLAVQNSEATIVPSADRVNETIISAKKGFANFVAPSETLTENAVQVSYFNDDKIGDTTGVSGSAPVPASAPAWTLSNESTTKNDELVDDSLDLSWMRDIPTKPNKVECLLCNKIFTRKYCMNTHMILKHSLDGGIKCHVQGEDTWRRSCLTDC